MVYSSTLDENVAHLTKVLTKLRDHELYVKLEKCEFSQEEITFLGHVIGKGVVRMDEYKVQAIMEWPTPIKVT